LRHRWLVGAVSLARASLKPSFMKLCPKQDKDLQTSVVTLMSGGDFDCAGV
jgi:hypothetical protein